MNRYQEDADYVFSPPKYSRFWAPLICRLSDACYLRGRHKIAEVTVAAGEAAVLAAAAAGDSVLIAPNHSDHADPHVLLNWAGKRQVPLHFMATKEIFRAHHGINGKILQRAGVFSIDRDGTDLSSIKEALRIVGEGKHPLVMFPEGEIYHLNEFLTPLNDGVATIMLRTAKKLQKEKPGKRAVIFPTALRYRYIDDVSHTFPDVLDRLERYIRWKAQSHLSPAERIEKFGEALLALKEREYLNTSLGGDLSSRLDQFREILISAVEQRRLGSISAEPHPERIRRLRGRIRSVLLGEQPLSEAEMHQCYEDFDRLHLAAQLFSYPPDYLHSADSTDRMAETLLKFEEDIFGETVIRGRRTAEIVFCDPVNVGDFLERYGADPKTAVHGLTLRVEQTIQSALRR